MISDNIPILSVALGLSQPGKDLVSSTASLQRILKSLPVSARQCPSQWVFRNSSCHCDITDISTMTLWQCHADIGCQRLRLTRRLSVSDSVTQRVRESRSQAVLWTMGWSSRVMVMGPWLLIVSGCFEGQIIEAWLLLRVTVSDWICITVQQDLVSTLKSSWTVEVATVGICMIQKSWPGSLAGWVGQADGHRRGCV